MTKSKKVTETAGTPEDVMTGKVAVTRDEIEEKGQIYAEITGKANKRLLTTPPFFPFINHETGESRIFRGYFVGVYENTQLKNPLLFKDEENNVWLFPANYVIKQTLESFVGDELCTTKLEIEFIEAKKTRGGNTVNIFRIFAC